MARISKEERPIILYEQMCLHSPIVYGNIPMINSLVELGANVNAEYFWLDIVEGQSGYKSNAGLIARLRWNFLDMLANSYFYGGGVSRKRLFLRPLITAITSDPAHCLPVVQLLLDHGADPSIVEYALDLRVDGQTKLRLISLLLAHEQILVLKDIPALPTLSDIALKRRKFLHDASQHLHLAGLLDLDNAITLFGVFETLAAHLRPNLAQALLGVLQSQNYRYCPTSNGSCLLKCAVYTNDGGLIELVVDTIGAANGVNMWTSGRPWLNSEFWPPLDYKLKEERDPRIKPDQVKAACVLRTAVDAMDYQSAAALLHVGVSPFVGSLETMEWMEAKEICHSLQHMVPAFGAIETQDPIMLSLLLSYKRAYFPKAWQSLVLDYSIVERSPYRRAAKSQLLLVARYLGPKDSIAWAIERKYEAALKMLLDSSSTWLNSYRNDSEFHVLLQQAYDLNLAASHVERLCERWAVSA
jgi:hypothetical protein